MFGIGSVVVVVLVFGVGDVVCMCVWSVSLCTCVCFVFVWLVEFVWLLFVVLLFCCFVVCCLMFDVCWLSIRLLGRAFALLLLCVWFVVLCCVVFRSVVLSFSFGLCFGM